MAVLRVQVFSAVLSRTVPLVVYLPSDAVDSQQRYVSQGPYKTIYLLHGVNGDENDWLQQTSAVRFAKEKQVALVMPSGENRFYVDQPWNFMNYGEFVGRELVELTRRMFPLSTKREDTVIAGLSMGGYGALRNGFKYAQTFGAIGAFSSALIMDEEGSEDDGELFFMRRSYLTGIFGTVEERRRSEIHPLYLLEQLKREGRSVPQMFLTCGTEDFLLERNRAFVKEVNRLQIPVEYLERTGAHQWSFWEWSLQVFLEWLVPDQSVRSVSSGDIQV